MDEKKSGISKYKKLLIIVGCLLIILVGANVYASIKGYGNISFLVKQLINGKNDTSENNENSSNKDTNMSYEKNNNTETATNESSENTEEIKNISEVELKKYLGEYVKLITDDIYLDNESHITKEEWENQMKMLIAMDLIYDNEKNNKDAYDIKFTQSKVKQVIKEFYGEEISGILKLPKDGFVSYNESNKCYENDAGDGGIIGLCREIKNINYNEGIYEVTFTYCYPSEENYTLGNIDKLALYETTMKLKLNSEYKYTKYCLVDFDKNEYKKIKESEIKDLNYDLDDSNNTEENNM